MSHTSVMEGYQGVYVLHSLVHNDEQPLLFIYDVAGTATLLTLATLTRLLGL